MANTITQNLQDAALGYSAALAADSLNPQVDYSLDGQTVTRSTWRRAMMAQLIDANKTINAINPYIIITKQVL